MVKSTSKRRKSATKQQGHRSIPKIVYLDNNSTTLPCEPSKKAHTAHLECYNPSSDSMVARGDRKVLEMAREYITKLLNAQNFTIIFTSGATESNCFILRSSVDAYWAIVKNRPHIVVSETEHASIIECINSMKKRELIDVTWVKPNTYGCILASAVEAAIKPNTALVVCIYANNEIGCISNLSKIAEVTHKHDIPLFSDCVQIFGKYKMDLQKNGIDALSVSFHKLYGPKGVGLLILRNSLIQGYELGAQINGHQQNELRGGTENVAGIASAIAACKWNFSRRESKNSALNRLRACIIAELSKHFPVSWYHEYVSRRRDPDSNSTTPEIIIFGPKEHDQMRLPNTILLSIVDPTGTFCNVDFKRRLDKRGIIVSIGSACNTTQKSASHVVKALGCDPIIRRGILRISLGDYNTQADIDRFINVFIDEYKKMKKIPKEEESDAKQ